MSFAEPLFLFGLLLVPLAIAATLLSRRRARQYAVRFTAMPALKAAAGTVPAWRRYVPVALVLAALTALVMAVAKPQRTVAVPVDESTIILVTDHSRSMLATDVDPDRITAAKRAARSFLDDLPAPVRVGVVAFSDTPDAVQAPSIDHEDSRSVIDEQIADGGTATGEALQVAIDTINQDRRNGEDAPAAIVLLSDGQTTIGRDPVGVAEEARDERIPIFTISLGTESATVPNPGTGPPLPAIPDPETLEDIAEASGGRSFAAEDDEELSQIYDTLGSTLGTKDEKREITSAFAIGGALLLVGAGLAAVRFGARLP